MPSIKYTRDHPAFQRVSAWIEEQVYAKREKTIAMVLEQIKANPALVAGRNPYEVVADLAYQAEVKQIKRLERHHGLHSKYIPH